MQKSISLTRAFSFACKEFIHNFGTIFGVNIFWMLFGMGLVILFLIGSSVFCFVPVVGLILSPLLVLFSIAIACILFLQPSLYQMQLIRIAMVAHHKQTIEVKDLFNVRAVSVLQFAFLRFLRNIIIGIGTIFFIIPGIYFAVVYAFPGYTLIDGTTDSMEEDFNTISTLTRGARLSLFFAFLVTSLFSACAIVYLFLPFCWIPPLAWTVIAITNWLLLPLVTLFYVSIYEQLKEQA